MKKIFKLKPILFTISILMLIFCLASYFSGVDLNVYGIDLGPVAGISTATFNLTSFTMPDDLGAKDGDEGMGGFSCVGYLALRSHIATYPTEVASPSTMAEMVTLTGNYILNASKYFIPIYMNPDSVFVNSESQGDGIGNKSLNNKGGFMLAGYSDDVRGTARLLNNSSGVFILCNDDGTRTSFGTYYRPVTFKPKGKSGSKASDSKGFEFEFTTDSFVPGYTYNGEIPLSGSTLPAIS